MIHTTNRLNIHLYVTPVCNLRCKHCYYDAWPVKSKPERLLTIHEMSHVLISLSNNYAAAFDVEGGEFFLRQDITELFDTVPMRYWSNVTITTNGTIPVQVSSEYLRQLDEFRVSVEGHCDNMHADIRGIGLEPVMRTATALLQKDIPVILRITLHKQNYMYIADIVSHFVERGFTRFSMYEFQATGRGRLHHNEYDLSATELEESLMLLLAHPLSEKVDLIKLSLSARRIPLIMKYQHLLEDRGYDIVDLADVNSLTVNYNGVLGVCPWNIGLEEIGRFQQASFISDIRQYVESGVLNHKCDHCSAIRILYRPMRNQTLLEST